MITNMKTDEVKGKETTDNNKKIGSRQSRCFDDVNLHKQWMDCCVADALGMGYPCFPVCPVLARHLICILFISHNPGKS